MKKVYRYKTIRVASLILVATPVCVLLCIWALRHDSDPVTLLCCCVGILFFGFGGVVGAVGTFRLLRNDEAVVLTSDRLTIRSLRGHEIVLAWPEISHCDLAEVSGQHFILLYLSDLSKLHGQIRSRFDRWLIEANVRLTGSPVAIQPSVVRCDRLELYSALCEYVEKYGRSVASSECLDGACGRECSEGGISETGRERTSIDCGTN